LFAVGHDYNMVIFLVFDDFHNLMGVHFDKYDMLFEVVANLGKNSVFGICLSTLQFKLKIIQGFAINVTGDDLLQQNAFQKLEKNLIIFVSLINQLD
jgi:Holliday junction resolvasome RuvABC ATP-dependent DNA helicase subunit